MALGWKPTRENTAQLRVSDPGTINWGQVSTVGSSPVQGEQPARCPLPLRPAPGLCLPHAQHCPPLHRTTRDVRRHGQMFCGHQITLPSPAGNHGQTIFRLSEGLKLTSWLDLKGLKKNQAGPGKAGIPDYED